MAKPRFVLKEPAASEPTLIFLIYRIGSKRLKYSTGESIKPKYWDKTAQRPVTEGVSGREIKKSIESIRLQIERHNSKVVEYKNYASVQKIPLTIDRLKESLDDEFKLDQDVPVQKDLFSFIEDFIKNVQFTRQANPKPISIGTIKKYNVVLGLLKRFADKKRKGKLDFDDIDLKFYGDFVNYLQQDCKHTPNTIGKNIKTLKLFLKEATEEGINTNRTFENRKFAAMSEDVDHVYLNESELSKLFDFDLKNNNRLDTIRDLFLIGCHTALRFSDFTNIQAQNIIETENGKMLKIHTFKTGQTVIIPLHWRVEIILKKWENNLPRAISNQKMNNYLKELGKLAEINTPFETNKTIAGKKTSITKPKYELITTHTARRSAATNMFKMGIPALAIMRITGHKTEKAFLRYINISNEENATLLMNHSYFKEENRKVGSSLEAV